MMLYPNLRGLRISVSITVIVCLLFFSSCMKKEVYPEIPEIAFQSFVTVFDTGKVAKKGYLTISFKDGDGDIGLRPEEKQPPYDTGGNYYYNFVIDYWEKQNGTFVKLDLLIPFSARIPYLTPNSENKAIKGFIVDTLSLNPMPAHDTIKFKFFIYDRALHKSNVDSTPPIIIRRK
jgi:hypothetical protein